MTHDERLLDLLAARATEGLSDEEARELERLLDGQTELGPDDLDLAAAQADLYFQASEGQLEPMPDRLERRILDQAEAHLPPRHAAEDTPATVAPFRGARAEKPGLLDVRYLGWYAAAAMLLLAIWAPWSPEPPGPAPEPTLAEQRARLIADEPDLIRVAWAPPEIEAYAGVRGDVVWSNRLQSGFMRLSGLPANESAVEQYQLWIVDPSRDERPIDGGVFDIPAGADEAIVPIDAKLEVGDPRAFAITLEKAGGVVVSDGPLLVVAAVEA